MKQNDWRLWRMIDDEKVLNHFYDSREVFVVDFDPKKVLLEVDVEKGIVMFKMRGG
jgi:hypothetical protein